MIRKPPSAVEDERCAFAEAALAALGIGGTRVRAHGEVARIEFPAGELESVALAGDEREAVVAAVRAAGFRFVSIDLGASGGG